MYKVIASSFLLAGLASALTVNTPASLVQCQPALLSWADGVAPYYLAVIPGGQPSAAALENLPTQQGNTYTWTVDISAGQSVTIKITDSTGAINYSDKVTVQAGTSSSCGAGSGGSAAAPAGSSSSSAPASRQPLASTSSSSSAAAAAATTLSSATSAPAPNSKTSATSASSGIPAAGASPSAATTSSKSNGAASLKAATGLLLGGLVFALAA